MAGVPVTSGSMPRTAALNPDHLRRLLGPDSIWKPIRWVASTGSTNDDLAARVASGARSGEVLMSEHQTTGKARFTRHWEDTPGTSLATSVLVKPQPGPQSWGWLSLLVGLAVREGVESYTGAEPGRVSLKWPNDVMLDGKKICGILCEKVDDYAVLGWGLNIAMDESELPVPTANSLLLAGLPHDKDELMAAILSSLQRWYELWQPRGEVGDEYTEICATMGRAVRLHQDVERTGTSIVEGTAVGVDATGAIIIQTSDGQCTAYAAGDVVHLR